MFNVPYKYITYEEIPSNIKFVKYEYFITDDSFLVLTDDTDNEYIVKLSKYMINYIIYKIKYGKCFLKSRIIKNEKINKYDHDLIHFLYNAVNQFCVKIYWDHCSSMYKAIISERYPELIGRMDITFECLKNHAVHSNIQECYFINNFSNNINVPPECADFIVVNKNSDFRKLKDFMYDINFSYINNLFISEYVYIIQNMNTRDLYLMKVK